MENFGNDQPEEDYLPESKKPKLQQDNAIIKLLDRDHDENEKDTEQAEQPERTIVDTIELSSESENNDANNDDDGSDNEKRVCLDRKTPTEGESKTKSESKDETIPENPEKQKNSDDLMCRLPEEEIDQIKNEKWWFVPGVNETKIPKIPEKLDVFWPDANPNNSKDRKSYSHFPNNSSPADVYSHASFIVANSPNFHYIKYYDPSLNHWTKEIDSFCESFHTGEGNLNKETLNAYRTKVFNLAEKMFYCDHMKGVVNSHYDVVLEVLYEPNTVLRNDLVKEGKFGFVPTGSKANYCQFYCNSDVMSRVLWYSNSSKTIEKGQKFQGRDSEGRRVQGKKNWDPKSPKIDTLDFGEKFLKRINQKNEENGLIKITINPYFSPQIVRCVLEYMHSGLLNLELIGVSPAGLTSGKCKDVTSIKELTKCFHYFGLLNRVDDNLTEDDRKLHSKNLILQEKLLAYVNKMKETKVLTKLSMDERRDILNQAKYICEYQSCNKLLKILTNILQSLKNVNVGITTPFVMDVFFGLGVKGGTVYCLYGQYVANLFFMKEFEAEITYFYERDDSLIGTKYYKDKQSIRLIKGYGLSKDLNLASMGKLVLPEIKKVSTTMEKNSIYKPEKPDDRPDIGAPGSLDTPEEKARKQAQKAAEKSRKDANKPPPFTGEFATRAEFVAARKMRKKENKRRNAEKRRWSKAEKAKAKERKLQEEINRDLQNLEKEKRQAQTGAPQLSKRKAHLTNLQANPFYQPGFSNTNQTKAKKVPQAPIELSDDDSGSNFGDNEPMQINTPQSREAVSISSSNIPYASTQPARDRSKYTDSGFRPQTTEWAPNNPMPGGPIPQVPQPYLPPGYQYNQPLQPSNNFGPTHYQNNNNNQGLPPMRPVSQAVPVPQPEINHFPKPLRNRSMYTDYPGASSNSSSHVNSNQIPVAQPLNYYGTQTAQQMSQRPVQVSPPVQRQPPSAHDSWASYIQSQEFNREI